MAKKLCNILIELGILSLIIFPPMTFGAIQFRHIAYIHAIILGLFVIWGIKVVVKGSFSYIPTPFALPMLLFLGIGIVNLLTSTYAHNTERELYLFMNYALLYFLVVQQLKTTRRIIGLAFIILLVGSAESLFGLFQYLQGAKTVLGYATPNIGTINATYFNHNHFAGFLILVIPVALGLLLGTANLEKKFFVFLLIALLGAALVLTLSRGGLLSLLLAFGGFFLCFILKERRYSSSWRKYLVLVLLIVICIGGYVFWIGVSPIAHRSLFETFFPTREAFEQEIRFSLWKNALALVKEFPVFGSGLGTFEYVFLRHRPETLPLDRQAFYAHNDYLELLVEMGFPAFLIVIWAIFRFYRTVLRAYFEHRDPVLTPLALGGLTSCTAMCIHSFFDFNMQIPANALLFFIVLAMTTATVQLMSRGRSRTRGAGNGRYSVNASWKFALGAICVFAVLGLNFRKNIALIHYSRARTLQLQRSFLPAIQGYQKALSFNGNNAFFHEELAKLYQELGDATRYAEKWYRFAEQEYQTAIELNAYNSGYYLQLGRTYDELEMPEEAIQAFKKAIEYNPHIPFYYENLGNYYLSFDLVARAMEMYQKALHIDPRRMNDLLTTCQKHGLDYKDYQQLVPQNARSRKIFASLLAQQGSWEQGKREYRNAITLAKGQSEYYHAMLDACKKHHDYQCMRTLWQELWQQSPQNLELPIRIAESFAQQHMLKQAVEQYQAVLQKHPEAAPRIYQRVAELYQQQGKNEEALHSYTQLLEIKSDDPKIYHAVAAMYRQRKDLNAAINIYKQAIETGLAQPDIYSSLGSLYLQSGNEKDAIEAYNQAIQNGEPRIEIYQALERLYQAQGNKIGLDLLWDTYAVVNRHHPKALYQLAQYYQSNGKWLKAVTVSKEMIANAPTNATYRKFLAGLYEQKKMLHESVEQWEKIVKLHSGNVEYKLYLASLYEKVNLIDDAKMLYRKILRIQPNNQHARQKLSSLGG